MTFFVVAVSIFLIALITSLSAKARSKQPAKLEPDAVRLPIRPLKPVAISAKPIDLSVLPERFIVLDLETTGLRSMEHEIIEIGAIRVSRDSTAHETFHTLVTPAKPLPKEIARLTGITQQMLDHDSIPLETAIDLFMEFHRRFAARCIQRQV